MDLAGAHRWDCKMKLDSGLSVTGTQRHLAAAPSHKPGETHTAHPEMPEMH